MESAGKQKLSMIPVSEDTQGYVYLPVSYTEQLADRYPCPDEDENPLGPADVRWILKSAPVVEEKLTALGLSCQVDDYMAMYVIPANEIPAQDVRVMEGSIHLAPKINPASPLFNSCWSWGQMEDLKLKPLHNRVTSLGATIQRLETDFDTMKKLMQVTMKKVHKLHLQVLILRACNNLASKLGLEKGANQRWFEFLQTLKEDQWRQGQLGRDARDILIETSMWVDVHLTTTNEDMAKAIGSLKRIGKDDIDRGLSNWKSDNVPTGKSRRGWDKAFRLESAEEVSGWDELFKLASGSEKSFPEFLDDYDYEDPSSSSSPPPIAALAVPALKQHL